jgi:hypothetical protein
MKVGHEYRVRATTRNSIRRIDDHQCPFLRSRRSSVRIATILPVSTLIGQRRVCDAFRAALKLELSSGAMQAAQNCPSPKRRRSKLRLREHNL